jgi:hypothetical protein
MRKIMSCGIGALYLPSDFFEQVIFSTMIFNDDEHFAFTTDAEGEFNV